jgi:hypothetical protein
MSAYRLPSASFSLLLHREMSGRERVQVSACGVPIDEPPDNILPDNYYCSRSHGELFQGCSKSGLVPLS